MDELDRFETEVRWNKMSERERAILRQSHPELREFLDELERQSHLRRIQRQRFWLLAFAVIGLLAIGYVFSQAR